MLVLAVKAKWLIPVAVWMLLFATMLSETKDWLASVRSALTSRTLTYLGDLSYCIYILHFSLIGISVALVSKAHVSHPIAMAAILGLTLTVISAVACHHFIEVRGNALGRSLGKRWTPVNEGLAGELSPP